MINIMESCIYKSELVLNYRGTIGSYQINDYNYNDNDNEDSICEIVCINLIDRKDRRDKLLKNFTGYPIRFYKAKRHVDPKRGCLESHINCIKYAKKQGFKSIMILEDDAEIIKDLTTLPPCPDNCDMIYLGALATKVINNDANATKISDMGDDKNGWIRGHFMCNHAYIVRDTVYDEIIEKGWVYKDGTIDDFLSRELHHKINAYTMEEPYVIQSDGYSDLDNKEKKWSNFKWPKIGEEWTMP